MSPCYAAASGRSSAIPLRGIALRGARFGHREQPLADRIRLAAEVVEPRQRGEALQPEDALEERRHLVADGATRPTLTPRLGDQPSLDQRRNGRVGGDASVRATSGRETGPR